MDADADSPEVGPVQKICFWTNAPASEIKSLTEKVGLSANEYFITKDSPGGVVTIAMGGERLKDLQQRGVVPKGRSLDTVRGTLFPSDHGPTLVSFDPYLKRVRADALAQITWDVRLAKRLLRQGSLKPKLGDYQWKEDLSEFIETVREKHAATGASVDVALDLETMGLYPWSPGKKIITVQVSCEEGKSDVIKVLNKEGPELDQFVSQLRWLLSAPFIRLKGSNLKFDLLWIWAKWRIECTNFSMDTTVVGSMVDENRSNGLKWHAKEYIDELGGYDDDFVLKYDKAHMELVPDEDMISYAGADPDATLRVANVLKKELSRERLTQHLYVNLVHPALRAFEKIERRGVPVDKIAFASLREEVSQYITQKETEMVKMLSPRFRARHAEKIADRLKEGKAPLTDAMLREHFFDGSYGMGLKPKMFTPKSNPSNPTPSTAREHLTMFFDDPEAKEFVNLMTTANSSRKTRSTYIDGFLFHMREDGHLHPTYMLYKGDIYDDGEEDSGTNTGRIAAKDPAWQTVPKHITPWSPWAKKLRKCFPAPPGRVYWGADFNQGELKIVGCVANEQKMIDVYKNGGDLHCVTGAAFAGVDVVTFTAWQYVEEKKALFAEKRQHGKHGNFGMLYGISPEGFQRYAWRKGIALTLAQATKYLNDFFELYSGLRSYHEKQKNFARQNGFVVSPLGRIRHLPLIDSPDGATRGHEERRAINAPIQSALSDLCIWAAARIEEELGDQAGLNGQIHDQIHGSVEISRANELIPQIKTIMETLPYREVFGWDPPLNFTTDAEIGPTLGELDKFKLPQKLAA